MKARKVRGLKPGEPLRPNAARIVATRLEELQELAPRALEPDGVTAQHDMRIAAKRLRYVLDVVAGCLGPDAEEARAVARELQSVLGEIHDCDVMLPKVEGVESVEAVLRTCRGEHHARFARLWEAGETQATLAGLSRLCVA